MGRGIVPILPMALVAQRELSTVFISNPVLPGFSRLFLAHCSCAALHISPSLTQTSAPFSDLGHTKLAGTWLAVPWIWTPLPISGKIVFNHSWIPSSLPFIVCISPWMPWGKKWQHHLDLKDMVTKSVPTLGTLSTSCNSVRQTVQMFTQADRVYLKSSSRKQRLRHFCFYHTVQSEKN